MNREEVFKEINQTQEFYVNELYNFITNKNHNCFKEVNFTSNTGTGKTRMIALLVNKMPEYHFIITTLSKGQLSKQIRSNLNKDIRSNNYKVYGNYDYTSATKIQAKDILNDLPDNKKIIWLRDEGHIRTNKWITLLENKCFKVVNISATNNNSDIRCNFTNTMMLRTVHQEEGTPLDAIKKLLEVKKQHKNIKNYNPCAIMRCLDEDITKKCINLCKRYKLKYINLTNNDDYDMSDLCRDDNEYDVILNKFKIVEGIDIRRAHVLYMTNEPSNINTTIQIIGRCRRNALLYRDDVDIFSEKNKELLKNTRQCFVFYNVVNMKVQEDENGDLINEFCDIVSCEKLKPNSIVSVEKGYLPNGLLIKELENLTGEFEILKDDKLGFNYVKSKNNLVHIPFYENETKEFDDSICLKITYYTREAHNSGIIKAKWHYPNYMIVFSFGYTEAEKYWYSISNKNRIKLLKKGIEEGLIKDIFIKQITGEGDAFIEYIYIPKKEFIIDQDKIYLDDAIFQKYRSLNAKKFFGMYRIKLSFNRNLILNPRLKIFLNNLNQKMITYKSLFNDRESAILGFESLKPIKVKTYNETKIVWVEDNSVTSKTSKYSKFNTYLLNKYKNEISLINKKIFNGKNNFDFSTKINSCLGYCVEYYAKYLLYGWDYLNEFIATACNDFNKTKFYSHSVSRYDFKNGFNSLPDDIQKCVLVRACELKYLNLMKGVYGTGVAKVIKSLSIEELISLSKNKFVDTVIDLGTKTFNFIKNKLSGDSKEYNPNLSTKHIKGMCDFIDKHTIIDVKTTNSITKQHLLQVLGYYYLSTKRSDLKIKRVIVYDAISNKNIEINLI